MLEDAAEETYAANATLTVTFGMEIPHGFSVLNQLANHVWTVAKTLGFHDEPVPMGDSVSNLHSEVSEMWEAYRLNKLHEPCDKAEKMKAMGLPGLTCLEEELADIVIRALDTAREHNIDIASAVQAKDAYNQKRPHRNGGKAA